MYILSDSLRKTSICTPISKGSVMFERTYLPTLPYQCVTFLPFSDSAYTQDLVYWWVEHLFMCSESLYSTSLLPLESTSPLTIPNLSSYYQSHHVVTISPLWASIQESKNRCLQSTWIIPERSTNTRQDNWSHSLVFQIRIGEEKTSLCLLVQVVKCETMKCSPNIQRK